MAKSNTKKLKKKVSNYDDRLIKIIAISLAVVVAAIVTIVCVGAYSDSYVFKVDGNRVMDYEYEYFLGITMEEMQEDAEDTKAFWTDEKKAEAVNKAIEDAREWKAEYLLSKKAGFGMSKKERSEFDQNLESNLYYTWYLQYRSYYSSFDSFLSVYLGNMSLSDYKDFAAQNDCIQKYRASLQEGYNPTDEALREKYDSDRDTYRRVELTTFTVSKPTKPTEVQDPGEAPKEPENKDETSTEWVKYQADKATYDTNKKKYDEYLEKVKEYEKEVEELKAKVDEIFKQLSETGKYTGKGITEVTPPSDDSSSSSSAEKAIQDYKDATLETLAKTEGAMFSSDSGAYEFTSAADSEELILDDYALSLDWTDDTRTAIKSTSEEEKFKTTSVKAEDGTVTTDIILLDDDSYFYITKCTGIKDFDTSVESTDDEKSVRDTVKEAVLSDMSEAELKEKVSAAGDKYAVKSKKQKNLDAVKKIVFG